MFKDIIKKQAFALFRCLLIIGMIVPAFIACDDENTPSELEGSWRFKELNYTYTQNGVKHDMKKDGSKEDIYKLYMAGENIKPLIFSFSAKALFLSKDASTVSTPDLIAVSGNEITFKSEDDSDYVMEYKVSGNELKLTLKSFYYNFVKDQLPEILSLQDYDIILYFTRGGLNDKDEAVTPPEGYNSNTNVTTQAKEAALPEMKDAPYQHPTSTDYPANFYSTHKNYVVTLYEESNRKICLGHKDGNFWLLVYDYSGGDWRIVQIYNGNDYLNSEYIFFAAGEVSKLADITEKREFNSGSGYTPLSFQLVNKGGYVIGYKVGNQDKFVRFRVKSQQSNLVTIEYQLF